MYRYYNANPIGNLTNDCTVRAISLATGSSWDATYEELSKFAQAQGFMADEVRYIDEYLDRKFTRVREVNQMTVGDFCRHYCRGTYLITMRGHITCCIDGVIYDTFDPSDDYMWAAYKVEKGGS